MKSHDGKHMMEAEWQHKTAHKHTHPACFRGHRSLKNALGNGKKQNGSDNLEPSRYEEALYVVALPRDAMRGVEVGYLTLSLRMTFSTKAMYRF